MARGGGGRGGGYRGGGYRGRGYGRGFYGRGFYGRPYAYGCSLMLFAILIIPTIAVVLTIFGLGAIFRV